jgi:biopolymer transport protein ExbD
MTEKPDQSSSNAPDINVTPLIDVLLVLLIIFMVITPLKPHRLESKIPEKASPPVRVVSLASVLSLSADAVGRVSGIKLNDEPVAEDQLVTRLRERLDAQPPNDKTVFIEAPRHAFFGEVVRIIDRAKEAGAVPIGLQIDDLLTSARATGW